MQFLRLGEAWWLVQGHRAETLLSSDPVRASQVPNLRLTVICLVKIRFLALGLATAHVGTSYLSNVCIKQLSVRWSPGHPAYSCTYILLSCLCPTLCWNNLRWPLGIYFIKLDLWLLPHPSKTWTVQWLLSRIVGRKSEENVHNLGTRISIQSLWYHVYSAIAYVLG